MPLLSIVIPAYNRPAELRKALESFVSQIIGKYESDIEIEIVDDASPGDSLEFVQDLTKQYSFIRYRRLIGNIGLEKNLIESTRNARGDFLWIFGDDDYLELDDALDEVMRHLLKGTHDFIVLNRTRRSADLTKLISQNWMDLEESDIELSGLREFCLRFGFISVIGFISVNIFRREPFANIDVTKYYGTMYPQLGAMVEAFHDRPTFVLTRPLVCHRTQTQEEKKAALGDKATERGFMADAARRDALFFSHPFVRMLDVLLDKRAFEPDDILRIPENTVIHGLLVDFLIGCIDKSRDYSNAFTVADWRSTARFFARLPLEPALARQTWEICFKGYEGAQEANIQPCNQQALPREAVETISVVTPSFNQAEFLEECLASVRDQTHKPIEHFVFDPGSEDNSRAIARTFDHVTLSTEPDRGQSDAVNKGLILAQGDIIAWLNSDDVFADDQVFERVIARFNEDDQPDIVYGRGIYIDEQGSYLRDVYLNPDPSSLPWRFHQEDGILQPALFMRRSVVERIGLLGESLHFTMDYEYWIRCMKAKIRFAFLDQSLAKARYHSSNKTYGQRARSYAQICDVMMTHFGYVNHMWLRRYAEFLAEGYDGVLAYAQRDGVGNEAALEDAYRQLIIDYNGGHPVYQEIERRSDERGYGDTLREMQRLEIEPVTPCRPVDPDAPYLSKDVNYVVGPQRWAFNAEWKAEQIAHAHEFLRTRIKSRESDICVIIGNGPSLNETDLSLLEGQDVIISNNAFLSEDLLQLATYYTVVNYLVAEQSAHHINRLRGVSKVLPYWLSYCLNEGPDTFFVDAVGKPEFSTDIFSNLSWRHTVTFFNLHLAYGLGYRKVILIGMDHSYKQKSGIAEQTVIQSQADDENHFDPAYFKGKKWQAADVEMMEEMYRLAKDAYEQDGRTIVNATVGGKLELFKRVPLEQALKGSKPRRLSSLIGSQATELPPRAVARDSLVAGIARDQHATVDETAVVAQLLRERRGIDHILIDVGAHFGDSSNHFHALGWTVHCFEPDPTNRARLSERFKEEPNITIDPRAVGENEVMGAAFFSSKESTGISGLHAFHQSHSQSGIVDVTTLDKVVTDQNLDRIDFLKIDVEGFDFAVLKGVPWDKIWPDVIECEFEDAKTRKMGHGYKDICAFLEARGYTVYLSEWYPIIRYGIPHDWRQLVQYPAPLGSEDAWGNILAFKVDPGLQAVEEAFQDCLRFRESGKKRGPAPTQGLAGKIRRRVSRAARSYSPWHSAQLEDWMRRHWGALTTTTILLLGALIITTHPALGSARPWLVMPLALAAWVGAVAISIGVLRNTAKHLAAKEADARRKYERALEQKLLGRIKTIEDRLSGELSTVNAGLGNLVDQVKDVSTQMASSEGTEGNRDIPYSDGVESVEDDETLSQKSAKGA